MAKNEGIATFLMHGLTQKSNDSIISLFHIFQYFNSKLKKNKNVCINIVIKLNKIIQTSAIIGVMGYIWAICYLYLLTYLLLPFPVGYPGTRRITRRVPG